MLAPLLFFLVAPSLGAAHPTSSSSSGGTLPDKMQADSTQMALRGRTSNDDFEARTVSINADGYVEEEDDQKASIDEVLQQNATISVLLHTMLANDSKLETVMHKRGCQVYPLPSHWCPSTFDHLPLCTSASRRFRKFVNIRYICVGDGFCGSKRSLKNCGESSIYIVSS